MVIKINVHWQLSRSYNCAKIEQSSWQCNDVPAPYSKCPMDGLVIITCMVSTKITALELSTCQTLSWPASPLLIITYSSFMQIKNIKTSKNTWRTTMGNYRHAYLYIVTSVWPWIKTKHMLKWLTFKMGKYHLLNNLNRDSNCGCICCPPPNKKHQKTTPPPPPNKQKTHKYTEL